jgi:hypothetical protein
VSAHGRSKDILANLFLLHKLGVGTVVDDIFAEDRRRQDCVNFYRVHVSELAVQDKVVTMGTHADRRLLSEENESVDIAILVPRGLAAMLHHGGGKSVTFLRISLKNFGGSIPYVTVLPMKGNQWKTTGGSFAFLRKT